MISNMSISSSGDRIFALVLVCLDGGKKIWWYSVCFKDLEQFISIDAVKRLREIYEGEDCWKVLLPDFLDEASEGKNLSNSSSARSKSVLVCSEEWVNQWSYFISCGW